jgi:hypothetical protein
MFFIRFLREKDQTYLETILGICKNEKIDVYYVLGEEEVLATSKNELAFEAVGTKVITSGTPEMLSNVTN